MTTDQVYSNEMELRLVKVGDKFVSEDDLKQYAERLTENQRLILSMGPCISFVGEITPYVERIKLSWIEKLFGMEDRVIRYRGPDLSGWDYKAAKQLEIFGLLAPSEKRQRLEYEVGPRPEDRFDVETFKPNAKGYAAEETWRWTARGKAVAQFTQNPTPTDE